MFQRPRSKQWEYWPDLPVEVLVYDVHSTVLVHACSQFLPERFLSAVCADGRYSLSSGYALSVQWTKGIRANSAQRIAEMAENGRLRVA